MTPREQRGMDCCATVVIHALLTLIAKPCSSHLSLGQILLGGPASVVDAPDTPSVLQICWPGASVAFSSSTRLT
jgi:hypothetical protein